MERHFGCTACGKCCEGWLPLAIPDALAHADRFPLFLLWSPVRPGGKSYELTAQLGFTLELKNRKQVAVRVTPFSYVPPHVACPALGEDGLCGVHDSKPQRCRTMPLSGARAENDQTDLLIPKAGWDCDVSGTAPLLSSDHKIIERADFMAERQQLLADAAVLEPFANLMLDSLPKLRMELQKVASKPQGGHVITNFSTLLSRLPQVDVLAFAAQQLPVLEAFMAHTQGQAKHANEHQRYSACADEWRRMLGEP